MKKHLQYLGYVVRHKAFVFRAGLATKAPLWRLLIHDWSKFLPCEWTPYVDTFYVPEPVPSYGDARVYGGLSPVDCEKIKRLRQEAFDRAWLHHQHSNPHHWQHWLLVEDDTGKPRALEMPDKFVREMVADWAGAGRAITGRWDLTDWYEKNRDKMILHPNTRHCVETLVLRVKSEFSQCP